MSSQRQIETRGSMLGIANAGLKEIVMGLHWDPQTERSTPVDLDALCVLFDGRGHVLEVVHPGHPRGGDDSMAHTGDSRTGASTWDDEQIFVFLDGLPMAAAKLAFVVLSATGQPLDQVPGASCHVSDHGSGEEYSRVNLTTLFGDPGCIVATLTRGATHWSIDTNVRRLDDILSADLLERVRLAK